MRTGSFYPGGIAIWGALNAIYDTTNFAQEEGVHVHARKIPGGEKQIDWTFDLVEVPLSGNRGTFTISGDDGSNYNVATILGRCLTHQSCPECCHVHCDKGFSAVHYHLQHGCERCGHVWTSDTPTISNPIMLLKEMVGDDAQQRPIVDPLDRTVRIDQRLWPGGIQLWGSNPAIIWTSKKLEEGGVHVHTCRKEGVIAVDETFGTVWLDDVRLDPEQVRHLMAQQALKYLRVAIRTLHCPRCKRDHFDKFDQAIVPHGLHVCEHCDGLFDSPEACVSNPLVTQLEKSKALYQRIFPTAPIDKCKTLASKLSS
jgi:hypothetical protein